MARKGRDPFTNAEKVLLAARPATGRLDVRIPRASFADFPRTDWMFFAGGDSTMIGNYLTTYGRKPELDHQMVRDLGLSWKTYDGPPGGVEPGEVFARGVTPVSVVRGGVVPGEGSVRDGARVSPAGSRGFTGSNEPPPGGPSRPGRAARPGPGSG